MLAGGGQGRAGDALGCRAPQVMCGSLWVLGQRQSFL